MPRLRSRWASWTSSLVRGVAMRGRISSVASSVVSLSRSRASRLASRIDSGTATAAVTSTETNATTHVTMTARTVKVVLRIGGVPDAADRTDHGCRVAELRAYLRDVDVDGAGAGVCRVAPHAAEQLLAGEHPPGAL